MTWADKFRSLRAGMTQSEVAKALCGISIRTVQEWELGRSQPPKWVQMLVAGHLMRRQMKK